MDALFCLSCLRCLPLHPVQQACPTPPPRNFCAPPSPHQLCLPSLPLPSLLRVDLNPIQTGTLWLSLSRIQVTVCVTVPLHHSLQRHHSGPHQVPSDPQLHSACSSALCSELTLRHRQS